MTGTKVSSSVLMNPADSDKAAAESGGVLIQAIGLRKRFVMGESIVEVLCGADLSVRRGEFLAIEGRSGSGKSTLLHILGVLDAADAGRVILEGHDVAELPAAAKAAVRNRSIGFVFQFYHLLPELNVLENTLLAAMVERSSLTFMENRKELKTRAMELLERLGMSHRLKHRPRQLSGGERQRVAIARALMNRPKLLLADEPTGNLDAETGSKILDVLSTLHQQERQTIIMVTHDRTIAHQADRVVVLRGGTLHGT
jgi:lipoprotein-releasing system ATP-binding protein